jgi:hypothetical protein
MLKLHKCKDGNKPGNTNLSLSCRISNASACGLLVAFVGTTFMTFDRFDLATVLAGAATGLTVGAVISGITDVALLWLLKPRLATCLNLTCCLVVNQFKQEIEQRFLTLRPAAEGSPG